MGTNGNGAGGDAWPLLGMWLLLEHYRRQLAQLQQGIAVYAGIEVETAAERIQSNGQRPSSTDPGC